MSPRNNNNQPQKFSLQPANQTVHADIRWEMRKLWMEHIVWTRLFIISAITDLPDASAAAARLIKNQQDIGNLIGRFYKNSGHKITDLLTKHIMIASELVEKAKDKIDISDSRKRWYQNADEISNYLYSINPNCNLRNHLYTHLQLTENELTSRISHNYQSEISFFDAALNQSVEMADILSNGIQQHQSQSSAQQSKFNKQFVKPRPTWNSK